MLLMVATYQVAMYFLFSYPLLLVCCAYSKSPTSTTVSV